MERSLGGALRFLTPHEGCAAEGPAQPLPLAPLPPLSDFWGLLRDKATSRTADPSLSPLLGLSLPGSRGHKAQLPVLASSLSLPCSETLVLVPRPGPWDGLSELPVLFLPVLSMTEHTRDSSAPRPGQDAGLQW